jgi:hypothetical protein
MMIEVEVDSRIIGLSRSRAIKMGVINNSITQGDGSIAGFVGEYITADILDGEVMDTYDYDILLRNYDTVDVKTKRVSSAPKDYYSCSVANFNTKQKCTYYAFTRVLNDISKAWYLGKISRERFYDIATFHKMGDIDPDNSFIFRADCYNIPIRELE